MLARAQKIGLTRLHIKCPTFRKMPGVNQFGVPALATKEEFLGVKTVCCYFCAKPLDLMWTAKSGKKYASCYKQKDTAPAAGCVDLVGEDALLFVKANLEALWKETAELA